MTTVSIPVKARKFAETIIEERQTPTGLPEEVLAALCVEDVLLKRVTEQMAAKRKHIANVIKANRPIGTHLLGDYHAIITRPMSLDLAKLEKAYPASAWPMLYVQTLDGDAVTEHLSPNELAPYKTPGAMKLQLRAASEKAKAAAKTKAKA